IQRQLPSLAARVESGTPLLGLEPSCLLALVDDWPELVPAADAQRVAAAAELAESWLPGQARTGRLDLALISRAGECLVHGHCHRTGSQIMQVGQRNVTTVNLHDGRSRDFVLQSDGRGYKLSLVSHDEVVHLLLSPHELTKLRHELGKTDFHVLAECREVKQE